MVKTPTTLTRESSGLYTVSSTLFTHVTREDRNSLYHCTVHYWLQGQQRAMESRRVNVTIFCESGGWGLCPLPSAAWQVPTPTLPTPSSPRPRRAREAAGHAVLGTGEGRG